MRKLNIVKTTIIMREGLVIVVEDLVVIREEL